jgi:hypothetical protein
MESLDKPPAANGFPATIYDLRFTIYGLLIPNRKGRKLKIVNRE